MLSYKECPTCKGWHNKPGKYCCYTCAAPAVEDAIRQLQAKEGPIYEKWKERLRGSIEHI